LRARAISFEESALLLRRFEEGLSGYTYLEEEPPGSPAVPAAMSPAVMPNAPTPAAPPPPLPQAPVRETPEPAPTRQP
jgi:hypothetical protein